MIRHAFMLEVGVKGGTSNTKTHPLGYVFVLDMGIKAANTQAHPDGCAFVLDAGVEAVARQRT